MVGDGWQGLDGIPLLRASIDTIPLLRAKFEENVDAFKDKLQKVRTSRIGRFFTRLPYRPYFAVLRPSFLDLSIEKKPAHPTAWIDGVRGIASFCVYIYHFQHLHHNHFYKGYGSNDGVDDYWLIQLPIIRLIFTGGPMVSVFWVLSGISLSLKPIRLVRMQAWDSFSDTMFSSVFRRASRLYLPCLEVQLGVLIATLLGAFNLSSTYTHNWPFEGTNEVIHDRMDTNRAQIADWADCMWKFLNPFRPFRPKYDVHLWTIPVEFRNSIILFATLVGFSKLRSRVRIGFTLASYLYCVIVEEGDVGLFVAGMALAEYLQIREEEANKKAQRLPSAKDYVREGQSLRAKVSWTIVTVFGLHLLSTPAHKYETTPGYITITQFASHFVYGTEITLQQIGAAITLLGLCGCEYLRKPFSTPVAVYLGKISFSLYIVHGPITHMLGIRFVPFFWSLVGGIETTPQYELGVILAFLAQSVVVVYVADIVMRTIDTPSVRFGRALQARCV